MNDVEHDVDVDEEEPCEHPRCFLTYRRPCPACGRLVGRTGRRMDDRMCFDPVRRLTAYLLPHSMGGYHNLEHWLHEYLRIDWKRGMVRTRELSWDSFPVEGVLFTDLCKLVAKVFGELDLHARGIVVDTKSALERRSQTPGWRVHVPRYMEMLLGGPREDTIYGMHKEVMECKCVTVYSKPMYGLYAVSCHGWPGET